MFELSRGSMGGQLQVVRSMDEAYKLLKVGPQDFSQRLNLFPHPENGSAIGGRARKNERSRQKMSCG
jgi:hypothetical protein